MEPNQVHVVAAAVFRDSQQVIHALEPRFTREIVRDVTDVDRHNGIHDDVALVHLVTTTDLDVGAPPDANAASDSPAPDPLAKAFGEYHLLDRLEILLISRIQGLRNKRHVPADCGREGRREYPRIRFMRDRREAHSSRIDTE